MARDTRVVHLVEGLGPGVVPSLLRSLLPRLRVHGIESRLVSLCGPGSCSPLLAESGFPPEHLAGSRWDPRVFNRLRRVLRQSAPDLVHAHGAGPCFLAEILRPPRLVEHLHHLRGAGGPLQRLVERGLYRSGDLLVVSSQAIRRTAPARAGVALVYSGVDPVQFRPPSAVERSAARARFGLSRGDFALGVRGLHARGRDHAGIASVIATLAERYPQLRPIVTGVDHAEGLPRAWRQHGSLAGRVIFPGHQPEAAPLLHALDAWVLATNSEEFPLPLVEAMATGLPCIAGEHPATQELITHGEHGLLYPPGGLAEAVADCVESPGRRLEWGGAARDRVLREFTLDLSAARLAAAYRSLL